MPAQMLPGELAREALEETARERAPVPYHASRSNRSPMLSPEILDVTGARPSSGLSCFLAGAACAVLILTALYFSL